MLQPDTPNEQPFGGDVVLAEDVARPTLPRDADLPPVVPDYQPQPDTSLDLQPTWNDAPQSLEGGALRDAAKGKGVPMMPLFAGSPTDVALQEAEWDYENPQNKDKGVKGFLKEALSNFLAGMGNAPRGEDTDLWSTLGAGLGSTGGGALNRTANEKRDAGQRIGYLRDKRANEHARQKAEQEAALRGANIEIATQKPGLEKYKADTGRMRAENDLLYKTETIALGKRKADELKIYRDAIVELKEKGADQYDVRLKQLQEVIDESKRRNQEAEKDKDLDREARITVAQITAGSRERVANINQGGQNYRTEIKNDNDGKATLVAIDSAAKPEGETDEQFNARKQAAKESIYKQYPNLRPK